MCVCVCVCLCDFKPHPNPWAICATILLHKIKHLHCFLFFFFFLQIIIFAEQKDRLRCSSWFHGFIFDVWWKKKKPTKRTAFYLKLNWCVSIKREDQFLVHLSELQPFEKPRSVQRLCKIQLAWKNSTANWKCGHTCDLLTHRAACGHAPVVNGPGGCRFKLTEHSLGPRHPLMINELNGCTLHAHKLRLGVTQPCSRARMQNQAYHIRQTMTWVTAVVQ